MSMGFPDASVPVALKAPVVMAVLTKTVTSTSSYSALTYFDAFADASDSALLVTFPSLPVLTNLSASSGATRSGLFVFCDLSHCCSCAATVFSGSPVCWACDDEALTSENKASKHNIEAFFKGFSKQIEIFE